MNNVVVTSITVTLTVKAASKKTCLKCVVANVIKRSKMEGRYVVNISFVNLRLNLISILMPSSSEPIPVLFTVQRSEILNVRPSVHGWVFLCVKSVKIV